MAFQHSNRLTAHWQPKHLTGNAKAVAQYLASNIQSKGEYAGRYFHSGEKIAEALGISLKTTYKAIGQLLAIGLFDYETIHRGSRLRTYSLALECPNDCQATNHYTKLEKALRAPLALAEVLEPLGNSDYIDTPLIGNSDYTYRELLNREIDIDIETLSGFDYETIYLKAISEALASVADKTANHITLLALIQKQPGLVVSKAKEILAKHSHKHPEAYLSKIAKKTPESLLETSDTSEAKEWPEALTNILRLNALYLRGVTSEEAVYDEYLRGSGAIPNDLYEIAKATAGTANSLEHLVAETRAKFYGFDLEHFSAEPLEIALSEWRGARRGEWGTDLEGYAEAERLDGQRLEYQRAFDKKQAELVEAWLKANPDGSLDTYLAGEQIEALEAERWANPELSAEREHYSRLILAEIVGLPEMETLDEYLTSNETLEQSVLPQLKAEALEFYNAFPKRPEGQSRMLATIKVWCEARKRYTHREIMDTLSRSFLGSAPQFTPWITSWLKDLTSDKETYGDWYVEPENRIAKNF